MARDVNDIVVFGMGTWSDVFGLPTWGFGQGVIDSKVSYGYTANTRYHYAPDSKQISQHRFHYTAQGRYHYEAEE